MSGGHYDYFTFKFDDFITQLLTNNNPKRESFKKLLLLMSTAIHDIEWVDSGDKGDGDEIPAIDAVFKFLTVDDRVLQKSIAYDNLIETISDYIKLGGDDEG